MPYNSSGVYTGPTGATNQVPGNVIRSATWDTINTDVATALTQVGQQLFNGPHTVTAGPYTVVAGESALIFNGTGDITVVMQSAATYQGYRLRVKTVAAHNVVSSASNIVPLTSTSAGTAILTATIGKWAELQSDGTDWIVMSAN